MHFRTRSNLVQIIRTKYDKDTKKAKNEIVGRLSKSKPELTDDLREKCSAEEILEIQRWIAGKETVDHLRAEYAARTLPEQIQQAAVWFAGQGDSESTRQLAAQIQQDWGQLRSLLRKKALLD